MRSAELKPDILHSEFRTPNSAEACFRSGSSARHQGRQHCLRVNHAIGVCIRDCALGRYVATLPYPGTIRGKDELRACARRTSQALLHSPPHGNGHANRIKLCVRYLRLPLEQADLCRIGTKRCHTTVARSPTSVLT